LEKDEDKIDQLSLDDIMKEDFKIENYSHLVFDEGDLMLSNSVIINRLQKKGTTKMVFLSATKKCQLELL